MLQWKDGARSSSRTRTSPKPVANQKGHTTVPAFATAVMELFSRADGPNTMPIARRPPFTPFKSHLSVSRRRFSSLTSLHSKQQQQVSGVVQPPPQARVPKTKSPLKIWPFVLILAGGSYAFVSIVKQREGRFKKAEQNASSRPF